MSGPSLSSVPVHTWIVAYDIPDARRRRRVAKTLGGCGERVQFSVFECRLSDNELAAVRRRVLDLTETKTDRVRWYPLCGPCHRKVIQQGEGGIPADDGFWLV